MSDNTRSASTTVARIPNSPNSVPSKEEKEALAICEAWNKTAPPGYVMIVTYGWRGLQFTVQRV